MDGNLQVLSTKEANWLFPVIQISPNGSTLTHVLEETGTVGTGDNGLAIGWRRIITTHRQIDPSAE